MLIKDIYLVKWDLFEYGIVIYPLNLSQSQK